MSAMPSDKMIHVCEYSKIVSVFFPEPVIKELIHKSGLPVTIVLDVTNLDYLTHFTSNEKYTKDDIDNIIYAAKLSASSYIKDDDFEDDDEDW